MASLSAHFSRPDQHDQLLFHPQCPQCREERLEGALSIDPLVSRRAQAAITAGVLAFTSVAPTTALAAGGDEEVEGTAAPGEVIPNLEGETGFDPSPDAEVQPEDTDPASVDAGGTDEAVDPAVAPEPDASAAPEPTAAEATAEVVEEEEPVQEAEVPGDAPVTTVGPAAEPATPDVTGAPAGGKPKEARTAKNTKQVKRVKRVKRVKQRVVSAPAPVAAAAAPAPVLVASTPAPQPRTVVAAVAASSHEGRAAKAGDESHVVLRGESLWSIAADFLGNDPSPAKVAREVNRLWELNKSRIGTGDRNLVMAGTRLDLG